jgi:surface polysaccharide O-acyltransferase-like enzyme
MTKHLISNMMNKEHISFEERQYWIDYLRIFSSFLVVLIHVSGIAWYNHSFSFDWITSNIFSSLSHCAVPIFFMISGMLFLDEKKELSLKKLLLHNFLKIYVLYILSMLGYGIWMLIKIHNAKSMPLDSLSTILPILFQGNPYLWFLHMLSGIYLILPLLRLITASGDKSKKAITYYLLLFMSIRLVFYTISSLHLSTFINEQISNYLSFSSLNTYLAYFFLGYYLNTYGLSPKIHRLVRMLFFPAILFLIGIPILQVYRNQPVSATIFDGFSIFTYITSINVFLFFQTKKTRTLSAYSEKILILISKCTLGIYILHALVIDIFTELGLSIFMGPLILTIPIFAILVFITSFFMSYLLKKSKDLIIIRFYSANRNQ